MHAQGHMESKCVEHFMRFCVDTNIDCMQIADSLRKFVLAYQRNLHHREAFRILFGDAFINWDYIESRSPPKYDCTHWLALFAYVDFTKVQRTSKILKSIDGHLRSLDLDPDLACPIFLLKNTNHIAAQHGVERLLSANGVDEAYSKMLRFFALSADAAFEVADITAVLCHILQTCEIDAAEIERQIQFVRLKEEELAASFRVKQIRMVGGRVRLRSKLSEMQRNAAQSVQNMDRFDTWTQTVGFPSVFSLHIRRRLYFLMSQAHVQNPLQYVPSITNDAFICKAMQTATVSVPDAGIIHSVISSIRLVDEPFKELTDFRCQSLNAFPVTQLNAMTLNDLLHLYICAYQHPQIWKDVWKQLKPLISHQVVKDVEAFRAKYAYNFDAVLRLLVN